MTRRAPLARARRRGWLAALLLPLAATGACDGAEPEAIAETESPLAAAERATLFTSGGTPVAPPPSVVELRQRGAPIIASYIRWLAQLEERTGGIRHAFVVGGSTTAAFPEVGALRTNGETHCTGIVLAPRRVLTARHCVEAPYDGGSISFVTNHQAWMATPDQVFDIDRWHPHPSSDLAVLELPRSFQAPGSDPVGLEPVPLAPNDAATIVGYGRPDLASGTVGARTRGPVTVAAVETGLFSYGYGHVRACHADSGGPVLKQTATGWAVVGVISYGDPDDDREGPDVACDEWSVAVRIDPHRGWLEEHGVPGGS